MEQIISTLKPGQLLAKRGNGISYTQRRVVSVKVNDYTVELTTTDAVLPYSDKTATYPRWDRWGKATKMDVER